MKVNNTTIRISDGRKAIFRFQLSVLYRESIFRLKHLLLLRDNARRRQQLPASPGNRHICLYRFAHNWHIGILKHLPIVLCLLLTGCLRELSVDDPCPPSGGEVPLQVVIHWEDKPVNTLPEYMRIYWYPRTGDIVAADLPARGGMEKLREDTYTAICLDYYRPQTIDFRATGRDAGQFEAYNIPTTGLYNQYADPVPGEATVAEAYPYVFYADAREQLVEKQSVSAGDTLKLHFYPQNVLREFTFLIYGVEGAANMAKNSGAISGMSASYFPVTGTLAGTPSTVLFTRVTPLTRGQGRNWTQEQKELFARKNPDWASSDPLKGWTSDWITGKFSTFGPVDANNPDIRLTVEALSSANRYYYGAWGYWYGKWEDSVGIQILGAMGGPSGRGTWEEQTAWREQNGGFDIILYNDGRLVVPDGGGGGQPGGDGGFDVDLGDWDNTHVPIQ
ncbi:DUF5119 domain-containing protein [Dysgonomonas termitidis]